ncbi:MAG: cell division protein FtsZ, partial [Flavobacteriales bacterium]|nr:cell division protein FtsZ [Flavobacteriales bacterium]
MQFDMPKDQSSIIKVIGVGGGGSNAVNHMYELGIEGVDFIVCNTDSQALDISPVPVKVQLGQSLTEGRGAGSIPEVGRNAAIENIDDIQEILAKRTTMVFVTAGMGGGTGTGAAPVIARAAKDMGILTVGIVTIPFMFEGTKRMKQAADGLKEMRDSVDTLLVIKNDKLRQIHGNLSLKNAFAQADNILATAAKGIAELISVTGAINVDMNDVNTVMKDSGVAIMGQATAEGEDRAITAAREALESPLLNDNDIEGAKYILLNITYGTEEVMMDEISDITDFIQQAAGSSADVIWGHGMDDTLGEKISVTIIATGFKTAPETGFELDEPVRHELDPEREKEKKSTQISTPVTNPVEPAEPEVKRYNLFETDAPESKAPESKAADAEEAEAASERETEYRSPRAAEHL